MINQIISFSIKNKLIIGVMMFFWIAMGIYSMTVVPIDAVPDITNNQVQVITTSPNLCTEDIEQFVTYPVELAMANLPGVIEIRSVSRFGLSLVTIVFDDEMGTYLPRQLVSEKLAAVKEEIPAKFGNPFMGPISTGLGEIYQYTLEVKPEFQSTYSSTDLRTYQDWIVNRQMAMLPGVVEVNSFGGRIKQYEVAVDPDRLKSMGVTISEVFKALEINNENTGGAYIVKNHKANFIRGEGLVRSMEDLKEIVVKIENGIPILIKDVATVQFGAAIRYGSVTKNGKGQAVGGLIMMLKGENSNDVIESVKNRLTEIEKSLPEGVFIEGFLDRSDLISRTTATVETNLLEGGLIVIFVLVLFLGNFRGGLIVASTIPLSLLFAYILMNVFGVWSNLMSLGAIDFGIIIDGAVIIVESVVFYTLQSVRTILTGVLSQDDLDDISNKSSSKMMNAAFFGQLIILIVFIPILTLEGVEGKMFTPMAMTFSFAVIGAMILCLTYVPMVSALFMSKRPSNKVMWGDRFILWMSDKYEPILEGALKAKTFILSFSVLLLALAIFTFTRMGGEFMPQLDEGDLAMHAILKSGSSLEETEKVCLQIESTLLENFPEVKQVVSKIGVSEIPTDPMPMDLADMFLILKPESEWKTFKTKEEFIMKIKKALAYLPGVNYEFSQPVEMRFNELMTGVRQDVAVKLFGENLDVLAEYAQKMAVIIGSVEGVADLKIEATKGLPQMTIKYDRKKVAQFGLNIQELNTIVRTAFSGEKAGVIFEGEKRFDLVVRLKDEHKQSMDDLKNIYITLPSGEQIPMREVARISYEDGPMQISREGTNRRTYVGINVRGRDVESVVNEVQKKIEAELQLPAGYYIKYGGSFENLERAKSRLLIVVPIALILIFVLLYFALKSFRQTLMIYMAIPLAAIGGVFSLWLRDMPFSISAGIGFIVLFGVAVLNGLVLITSMNDLKKEGLSLKDRIIRGTRERIRPIFLTASTDILGFLPMAISTSAGAEVQRPLATVVIGGMLTASVLTLIIIPILYHIIETKAMKKVKLPSSLLVVVILVGIVSSPTVSLAQSDSTVLSIDEAVVISLNRNEMVKASQYEVERQKALKGTSMNINKTKFDFSYGQMNSIENDFGFTINQGFQFPTVYKNQSNLAKAKIANSELKLNVSENELKKVVKSAWLQLAYLHERQKVLVYQDSIYDRLSHAIQIRYETESSNYLERANAEVQSMQIHLHMDQNEADINIYKNKLQTLLNLDYAVDVLPTEDLKKRVIQIEEDATRISDNPLLNYYSYQSDLKEKEKAVTKSKNLPDFRIGYFNQSMIGNQSIRGNSQYYDSGDRFSGVKFGVDIPIWFGANSAKVKASELSIIKAKTEADYYESQLIGEFNSEIQEYKKLVSGLKYYETKALPQAQLILDNAQKSLDNGAINFVEYVHSIDAVLIIKYNYLEMLNDYNQSVIAVEYLLGR